MEDQNNSEQVPPEEEKSFLRVIVHSFFIIPFLIAVFCLLLFAGIHLLTSEKRTVYDYLEDVKIGGLNKRWQGAFELSKMLNNPDQVPDDERFVNELVSAFEHAEHDDKRIQQYLALAMGRTGKQEFVEPVLRALERSDTENIPAFLYTLGMLEDPETAEIVSKYVDHSDGRIRSIAVVALGSITSSASIPILIKALTDVEPNVQWGAAISLAQMGQDEGLNILSKLMDREYYLNFTEVDQNEQLHLMMKAIEAAGPLNDSDLNKQIKDLSTTDENMKIRALALETLN